MVKNPLAVQETWVLSWEDPPEKGTATHASILAWRISWPGEPSIQSMGSQSQTRLSNFHFHFKGQEDIICLTC